jgi:hypothetical protein
LLEVLDTLGVSKDKQEALAETGLKSKEGGKRFEQTDEFVKLVKNSGLSEKEQKLITSVAGGLRSAESVSQLGVTKDQLTPPAETPDQKKETPKDQGEQHGKSFVEILVNSAPQIASALKKAFEDLVSKAGGGTPYGVDTPAASTTKPAGADAAGKPAPAPDSQKIEVTGTLNIPGLGAAILAATTNNNQTVVGGPTVIG